MGVDDRTGPSESQVSVFTFTHQRADAVLPIVGEAGYRETLDRFSGGRDEDGPVFPDHPAVLVAEPDNRYDRDAIAVYICDEAGAAEQVGYLGHDDAVAYAPILRLVSPAIPMCPLIIQGGWDRGPGDRRYHSAVLNMGSPAEMAAEWWMVTHPPRDEHQLVSSTVAFVGDSGFRIGDVPLDSAAQILLASHAGCRTERDIGPGVRVCVVGDEPGEHTGQERRGMADDLRARLHAARRVGVELMPEERFWTVLGYALDARAGVRSSQG